MVMYLCAHVYLCVHVYIWSSDPSSLILLAQCFQTLTLFLEKAHEQKLWLWCEKDSTWLAMIQVAARLAYLIPTTLSMTFLCGPFCHSWRSTFKIQIPLPVLMREMIELFVPKDDDGTSISRIRIMNKFKVSI